LLHVDLPLPVGEVEVVRAVPWLGSRGGEGAGERENTAQAANGREGHGSTLARLWPGSLTGMHRLGPARNPPRAPPTSASPPRARRPVATSRGASGARGALSTTCHAASGSWNGSPTVAWTVTSVAVRTGGSEST